VRIRATTPAPVQLAQPACYPLPLIRSPPRVTDSRAPPVSFPFLLTTTRASLLFPRRVVLCRDTAWSASPAGRLVKLTPPPAAMVGHNRPRSRSHPNRARKTSAEPLDAATYPCSVTITSPPSFLGVWAKTLAPRLYKPRGRALVNPSPQGISPFAATTKKTGRNRGDGRRKGDEERRGAAAGAPSRHHPDPSNNVAARHGTASTTPCFDSPLRQAPTTPSPPVSAAARLPLVPACPWPPWSQP
jgi:hypothetical protein